MSNRSLHCITWIRPGMRRVPALRLAQAKWLMPPRIYDCPNFSCLQYPLSEKDIAWDELSGTEIIAADVFHSQKYILLSGVQLLLTSSSTSFHLPLINGQQILVCFCMWRKKKFHTNRIVLFSDPQINWIISSPKLKWDAPPPFCSCNSMQTLH